jgi:hypothetical protein
MIGDPPPLETVHGQERKAQVLNNLRIQHLLPDFATSSKRAAAVIAASRPRVGHLLPRFAKSPKRAATSVALVAGLAAGPLAGVAATTDATPSGTSPATAAANAVTGGSPSGEAPAQSQLMPNGAPDPSTQSMISLNKAQIDNANTIVATANAKHLPPRAAVIAVATSLQESKLENLGDLGANNDHDSLGLFQQRPSSGWGTPQQLTDPRYASSAFLNALQRVPDWQNLPLTDAAQDVQVSAFGGAYAQWEQQAADLVQGYYHAGHGADSR